MELVERQSTLTALQARFAEYTRKERARLVGEREFLTSVLEQSMGGAERQHKVAAVAAVTSSARQLVGLSG